MTNPTAARQAVHEGRIAEAEAEAEADDQELSEEVHGEAKGLWWWFMGLLFGERK